MSDILEVLVRSAFAFALLFIVTRAMGKTQISQLTYFDYIVGLAIGTMAATMSISTGKASILAATGLVGWTAYKLILAKVVLKSIPLRKILEGEPTVVIKNGKIMEEAMQRANYNIDELLLQLRTLKVFELTLVEEAVLEVNGKLSVLLKSQNQPVTPKDLQLTTKYKGMPQTLVVDGNIAHHRLQEIGLSEEWLKKELANQGIKDISEVMVAQLNTVGQLYVDLRADWPEYLNE